MSYPLDFTGRRILVTGASSGIGRATAILLAKLKARVVLGGRDAGRLESTLASLEGSGHRIAAFDLCRLDEIGDWVKEVAAAGPLAGLVHSAGILATGPLAAFNARKIGELLQSNIATSLLLAKAFRQKGCFEPGGSIVFLSSIYGRAGAPGMSLYGASKAAVAGMTRHLAVELAREPIRVNCITAGVIETEMVASVRARLSAEQFQAIIDEHPLGLGRPEDAAHAIAFLLGDTARWITGSELVLDGGYTAH